LQRWPLNHAFGDQPSYGSRRIGAANRRQRVERSRLFGQDAIQTETGESSAQSFKGGDRSCQPAASYFRNQRDAFAYAGIAEPRDEAVIVERLPSDSRSDGRFGELLVPRSSPPGEEIELFGAHHSRDYHRSLFEIGRRRGKAAVDRDYRTGDEVRAGETENTARPRSSWATSSGRLGADPTGSCRPVSCRRAPRVSSMSFQPKGPHCNVRRNAN
jgi:hypothetical protein